VADAARQALIGKYVIGKYVIGKHVIGKHREDLP
jgi:hypothetical protein